MKKSMVILVYMSSVLLVGMDNSHTVGFVIGKTTIQVTKGCMFDADSKDAQMVLGWNQQQQLVYDLYKQEVSFSVGKIFETSGDSSVYMKTKDSESASDDDMHKSYRLFGRDTKDLWKKRLQYKPQNKVLVIVEPCLTLTPDPKNNEIDYFYCVKKRALQKQYYGKDAIQHAKEDLALCYETVLNDVSWTEDNKHILRRTTDNTIFLSTLGTATGFPRKEAASVAVATILEYIKKNPNAYKLVHLFVQKRSEFALYNELLQKYLADYIM